jgi:hypothetical protein
MMFKAFNKKRIRPVIQGSAAARRMKAVSLTLSDANEEARPNTVQKPAVAAAAFKKKHNRIGPILVMTGASLISLGWIAFLVWAGGSISGVF